MCKAVCKPQTLARKMSFNLCGTSKFPAAQTVVREAQKPQVTLRETLTYGTKYGVGVFCLLKTGDEQIGWVPEKDQRLLEDVRKACLSPTFQVKIDRATCVTVGEAFNKIVIISIICDIDN